MADDSEALENVMRAGLFGGTFNPIHKGHLMAVGQALRRFSLDRVYIIPCREPPHKAPAYLAPAAQRIRMARLALPTDPRYCLSDIEIKRSGPSYTIDTVSHFRTRIIPGANLFLIMGMDAFLEIHTWKSHRRLLEIVQPVVVSRWVDDRISVGNDVSRMDGYIQNRLNGDYQYVEDMSCWQRVDKNTIHWLPTPPIDISSSQIRRRIRAGKEIADLVPPKVNAYIGQKELYR
jgi:nicotinate-nucleotide adenylyltransferase